jgi:hypothetical protein
MEYKPMLSSFHGTPDAHNDNQLVSHLVIMGLKIGPTIFTQVKTELMKIDHFSFFWKISEFYERIKI